MGWNRLVLGSGRRGIPGWFRGRRTGSGTLEVVLVPPKCWLFQEWGAPGVFREFFGSFSGVLCPCFHKHPALPRAHPRKNIPRSKRKIFGETFFLKTRGKCEILCEVAGTGAGDASPACAALWDSGSCSRRAESSELGICWSSPVLPPARLLSCFAQGWINISSF